MKLVKRMEIYHKKVSDIIFITTVHGPPKMGSKMSVWNGTFETKYSVQVQALSYSDVQSSTLS